MSGADHLATPFTCHYCGYTFSQAEIKRLNGECPECGAGGV